MTTKQDISTFLLRMATASGFLSAVASRLNLWGNRSSGWQNFVSYTAGTNQFLPKSAAPALAVAATIAELSIGLLLLTGYQTKVAATAAAVLTLLFALAMSLSYGIKEPLDYSVFAFSAACFLLSTMPRHIWSMDNFINL